MIIKCVGGCVGGLNLGFRNGRMGGGGWMVGLGSVSYTAYKVNLISEKP